MGKGRYLYNNLLPTATALTAFSTASGVVGRPVKVGIGSGNMVAHGDYTGLVTRTYTVEIDLAGDVGVATFRWKKDTTSGWEATGVLTSDSDITLEAGIKVKFQTGSGTPIFAVPDRWTFKTFRFFAPARLHELEPDKPWRSSALGVEWIKADLGSAKNVTAFGIHAHNITSGNTVLRIRGNATDSWGAPTFSQNLTFNADVIFVFIDETFRWWRFEVTDGGNGDGYIQIGEMFLGTFFEPTKNFVLPFDEGQEAVEDEQLLGGGISIPVLRNRQRVFSLPYGVLRAADRTNFKTMFEAIKDRSALRSKPLFWVPDSASPSDAYLVHWINSMGFAHSGFQTAEFQIDLQERPISAF